MSKLTEIDPNEGNIEGGKNDMHEYYFVRSSKRILRVKAPTLADAMIRLANFLTVEPRTFTTSEARDFLEMYDITLMDVEDIPWNEHQRSNTNSR